MVYCRVMANEDRLFGVWLGAKLFCEPSMRSTQELLWISKEDWHEQGPSVVARKVRMPWTFKRLTVNPR